MSVGIEARWSPFWSGRLGASLSSIYPIVVLCDEVFCYILR